MTKTRALTLLGWASPLLLLSLLVGGGVATWVFLLLSVAFPVLLMAIGAVGSPRPRLAMGVLLTLGLLLEAAAVTTMLLSGRTPTVATAVAIAGLGLVPLVLVGVGYAASWPRTPGDRTAGRR